MRAVFALYLVALIACNQSHNKELRDVADSLRLSQNRSTDFTKDSLIRMGDVTKERPVTVTGRLKGINHPIAVLIPVAAGNDLELKITTVDSIANIRINQVILPDGKADGPFGKTVKLKTRQKGEYKFLIGENLMQGEEWKGEFKLTVRAK